MLKIPLPTCFTALTTIAVAAWAGACVPGQDRLQPPLLEGMAPDPAELDMRTTPVVRAVRRAANSVVSIYVLRADPRRRIAQPDGQGSGVIVDDSGLVITNWHVVFRVGMDPRRFAVRVKLKDGRSFDASVISSSEQHDLALLQLDLPSGEQVEPVEAGDSDTLMDGETLIAIGNPQGHANTVTVGVLSARDRSITVRTPDGGHRTFRGLLQTDAAINQGNSGGALLDITGRLVGINNAMAMGVENIGFAMPVNTVKRVFEDVLLSADSLASVWIGLDVEDAADGPVVSEVDPRGPADRAGLRLGDRILRIAGEPVGSKLDYARSLLKAEAGRPLELTVDRRDRRVEMRVTPAAKSEWEVIRRTGLELETVSRTEDQPLLRRATLAFHEGSRRRRVSWLPAVFRVESVRPESPAAEAGFREGDVLYGLQVPDWFGWRNLPLRSIEDLADKIRMAAGERLHVLVLRGDETLFGELYVRRL